MSTARSGLIVSKQDSKLMTTTHITSARFNDVVKGRIKKCTVDRLLKMLAAIGKHVTMTVSDAA